MAVSRVNFRRHENTQDQRNIAEEAEANIASLDPYLPKSSSSQIQFYCYLKKKQKKLSRYIKEHFAAALDGLRDSPWSLINFYT